MRILREIPGPAVVFWDKKYRFGLKTDALDLKMKTHNPQRSPKTSKTTNFCQDGSNLLPSGLPVKSLPKVLQRRSAPNPRVWVKNRSFPPRKLSTKPPQRPRIGQQGLRLLPLGVGVGALLLAKGGHHVDEAPVVLHAPLGAARLLLLLLLFGHLGGGGGFFWGGGQWDTPLPPSPPKIIPQCSPLGFAPSLCQRGRASHELYLNTKDEALRRPCSLS